MCIKMQYEYIIEILLQSTNCVKYKNNMWICMGLYVEMYGVVCGDVWACMWICVCLYMDMYGLVFEYV